MITPDDVYVSQVVWEYYNGTGWRPLTVSGNRNPFSCKQEGPLEVVFEIPADLERSEVNAEEGYFIRARVIHVENQFSMNPRWVVPFLKGADCAWDYSEGPASGPLPGGEQWGYGPDGGCRPGEPAGILRPGGHGGAPPVHVFLLRPFAPRHAAVHLF